MIVILKSICHKHEVYLDFKIVVKLVVFLIFNISLAIIFIFIITNKLF